MIVCRDCSKSLNIEDVFNIANLRTFEGNCEACGKLNSGADIRIPNRIVRDLLSAANLAKDNAERELAEIKADAVEWAIACSKQGLLQTLREQRKSIETLTKERDLANKRVEDFYE